MKFILGTKIGMTSIYDDKGKVIPVTVVEVQPNVVVQVKNQEKDGYTAVQIGAGIKKKLSKADKGHRKNLGDFRYLKEFKTTMLNEQELKVGDTIDISVFVPGDVLKVTGTSKGKGFAGAVKRHGFAGMPASHGAHSVMRHHGSIGQRFPQHTLKGKRMAGRMGNERTTTRGLKVITVDAENKLIALKGAIPGNIGGMLELVTINS